MQRSFAAKDLRTDTLDSISAVIGPAETRELLQSLVASMDGAFADMRAARAAENFPAIARAAHRLAGGCGSLGALRMQDALRQLEQAATALSALECDAGLARLPLLAGKLKLAVDDYATAEAIAG